MLDFRSLKYKIGIIFLIPSITILNFTYKHVMEKYDSLQNSKILTQTTYFAKNASQLIHQLQKERGLSSGFLGESSTIFAKSLKKQRLNTDAAYKIFLDTLYQSSLKESNQFSLKIKDALLQLEQLHNRRKLIDTHNITFYKEVDYFSSSISFLISSIPHINRTLSSLSITNSMESLFYLISLKEFAGIERAFLSNIFSEKAISPEQARDIQELIVKQEIYYENFFHHASIKNSINYQKRVSSDIVEQLKVYREVVFNGQKKLNIDAMEWYDFATKRINQIDLTVNEVMHEILDKSIATKNSSSELLIITTILWLLLLSAFLILGLILYKLVYQEEKSMNDLKQQQKYYAALSSMSENIIYMDNRDDLYNSLCRLLIEISNFNFVWIGIVDESKQCIVPYASNKISLEELSQYNFSTAPDQKTTLEAPERAYLEKSHIILRKNNIVRNSKKVLNSNVSSIGSFPIYKDNKIISLLTIYSFDEDIFNLELILLIEKMLKGISFALSKIEKDQQQEITKEDLRIASYAFDSQEAMTITDMDAKIIKVNKAFTDITGYKEEEVLGENPKILQSSVHDKYFYQKMWEDLTKKGKWKGEISNRRKNGEIYPELLSITAIRDENAVIINYIAQFLDISDIKNAQKEAEHKAQHDLLTGVSNRAKLQEETEIAFVNGQASGIQHAFLFLDIDNFKQINDSYGHNVGDAILVKIASRLNSIIEKGDLVSRIGGDEFAIISYGFSNEEEALEIKATHLAERIQSIIQEPMVVDHQSLVISFSIGIKIFPNNEKSAQEVISHADTAMYNAKQLGRNQFSFFDNELDIKTKRFIMVEKDLKNAIKNNEFELYYQPKVDVNTNKIVGVEALLRWNHPTKGLISPDDFLDVANDTRLIHEIGILIIDIACKQLSLWKEKFNKSNYTISINISASQFKKHDFVVRLKRAIYKYDIDPSLLELELLEDTLIDNLEEAVRKIELIKEFGIKFAIDDFGTGYSSMTYLQKLPIDTIKIDKAFIADLNSKSNQEIVKMIINFANIFDLHIVAEGVENKCTLEFLKDNGCTTYQGYYFSRAVNLEEITKLLEAE